MKRYNPSIRTQLLAWLVTPLLLLLVVGGCLTYGLAIHLATDAYDKALLDSVYSVASCVQLKGDQIVVDMPPAALAILRDNLNKDTVYYQVVDDRGHVIAGDTTLTLPESGRDIDDGSRSADYRDARINGEDVRIASVKFPMQTRTNVGIYIQVAETLHGREHIAGEILIGIVLPQLAMVVFTALVVWFGVARGLKPLNRVRDAVASRTPVDLSPIPDENVPKEVRPLVRAINELLERLHDDMQAQRRFVANAAHQLRTPIAGLKTQVELALRQSDPTDIQHALGLCRTGAERAARLANQLLALARAEPGAVDPSMWQTIDLNEVARKACKESVPAALVKNLDLGFEESEGSALIWGDPSSLHEMIANLIDNAVLYTQSGGHVTVRVSSEQHRDGMRVLLTVEDDGPGIPEVERERVFERFYRLLDRNVSGSGLGLAIVREIAIAHEALVEIADGPGNVGAAVTIQFPMKAAVRHELHDHHRHGKESFAAASDAKVRA